MYAERETGGFAKGETTEGKAKLDRGTGATEALGGRNRPGPQDFEEQSPVRVQLPAKVAIEIEMPATQATRRSRARKPALLGAVLLLAVGAGGTFGYRWWTVGRFIEATDDAYVSAHNTTLAAKVAGYVSTIAVEDNSHVRAGDVIATIDDGDFTPAADAARGQDA